MPVPGPRPAAVQLRWVVRVGLEALLSLLARQQVATFGLELRLEQRLELCDREPDVELIRGPAARRGRHEAVALLEENRHALERERAPDALRDRLEHLLRRQDRAEPGRHFVQVLERGTVTADLDPSLQLLHRVRGLSRHRAEEVELVVARTAPGERLVDREDAEEVALRVRERDEEAVLRPH